MKSLVEHLSLRSVLAGWGPGLLHCVLWALSAPLLSPEEAEASSTDSQGGVAELCCHTSTQLPSGNLGQNHSTPTPFLPPGPGRLGGPLPSQYGIPAGSLSS